MPNLFNSVPVYKKGRNKFNLSFVNSFTADYGFIYPVMVKEVIPGDIWKMSVESFVRAQPLACPAFIRSDVSFHFFFVPNRLVYEDWSKFIVRGKDGDTDFDKPFVRIKDLVSKYESDYHYFSHGSLMDYLNFPSMYSTSYTNTNDTPVDLMTFNAYSLIYNEYYRDENLIPEVFIMRKSGDSLNYADYSSYRVKVAQDYNLDFTKSTRLVAPFFLRRRSWRKDYFTSALPFVQKGTPISLFANHNNDNGIQTVKWMLTGQGTADEYSYMYWYNPDNPQVSTDGQPVIQVSGDGTRGVVGYLTNAQLQQDSMTISDLRTALAIQQWFELNSRTGSDRYFEYLIGHFGVRDKDSRLQRPEYLGGFSHEIQVSEVEQTSQTDTTPQGNLAGKALGYALNRPVKYRIPEWGFLICLCSIRPRTPYYQGLPRMYQRWDAFDYYDPLFDHLSERAIGQSELYYDWSYDPQGGAADNDFGYTPIWSEYRTSLDELHGDFRADLSYWISPRKGLNSAKLNQQFIEIDPYLQQLNDCFAYSGSQNRPVDHFLFHVKFNCSVIRPMSKYGTPKL